MSFIGSMLGQNGTGLNFRAQGAGLMTPVTQQQATDAYNQSQQALQQQQQFVQALQGQNGIQNQSNVYNQLAGVAAGTGPNPAQAMLNQATGANVANQAALMAGQRGAGANVGLMARQAAQQGGALQQQAAGQGATMQANQSLGALGQMGGLASQQVGQQAAATQGLNQAAQSEQQNLLNSIAQRNQAAVGMQSNMNQSNAQIANTAAQGQQGLIGGLLGGVGNVLGSLFAEGGEVPAPQAKPHYADGGTIGAGPSAGPQSAVGKFLFGSAPSQDNADSTTAFQGMSAPNSAAQSVQKGTQGLMGGIAGAISGMGGDSGGVPVQGEMNTMSGGPEMSSGTMMAAKGGKVPAKVSPGELYIPPHNVKKVAEGKANPLKAGEKIPGKAKVKGNSYANDTVSKTLEAGGVVVPKSEMETEDPMEHARRFVAAVMAKHGNKMPKKAAK